MTGLKLALVTGSAGTIGSAISQRLADTGWRVIGIDLHENPQSDHFVAQLTDDVSQAVTWEAASRKVNELGPTLDGLVHCAALQVCTSLLETPPASWDRVIGVNLRACYLGCRALQPALAAGHGSVVAIGSIHARATSANIAAYAASKGGLSALVRALAIEWAEFKIRVNAVLPGAVDSAMLREGLHRGHLVGVDEQSLLDSLAKRTVMGHIGQPGDVAEATAFLLDSERSGFMTGSELIVDGGACIRLSTE
jgi:NAD(P)-dependent dehydrogenase (short-subunit alcohol dehydrogenase family)